MMQDITLNFGVSGEASNMCQAPGWKCDKLFWIST